MSLRASVWIRAEFRGILSAGAPLTFRPSLPKKRDSLPYTKSLLRPVLTLTHVKPTLRDERSDVERRMPDVYILGK